MIGNDIVDLQLASIQSNWQRRGWLQKIFTQLEQKEIYNSSSPDLQVWKFWSMKEAAYKAHQRCFYHAPTFNPNKIECVSATSVCIEKYVYELTTEFTKQYVYSIARSTGAYYYSKIFQAEKNPREELKKLIRSSITKKDRLYFKKDSNGIPNLYIDGRCSKIPFSLTHHGDYSAYVMLS